MSSDATMTADLERLRTGARAILALGIGASLAANVLAAEPSSVGRIIAAWSPVALFLTVELISRIPVVASWLSVVRIGATATIAGIAAWVSYWHMVEVALAHGEQPVAAHLLPLSVDGLVIVASVCMKELSNRLRSADVDESTEPDQGAAGVGSQTPEDKPSPLTPAELVPAVDSDELELPETTTRPAVAAVATGVVPAIEWPAPLEPADDPSPTPRRSPTSTSRAKGSAGERIATYMAEHPDAKQVEIAEALGITTKTVGRSEAWKNRHQGDEEAAA